MLKLKRFWGFLLLGLLSAILLVTGAACRGATTEDIRGFLQAVEGKEAVITLDDGSTIRVTVSESQAAAQAQGLVGAQVNVRVRVENGQRQLAEVARVGEDQKFTGVIESITGDVWKIGGRNFKVAATTALDGGLATGVTARVEFVTLADGTMLATEIETDQEDEKFRGAIVSMTNSTWVIGGETFQVNAATRRDEGLNVGAIARVEFVQLADGTKLAVKIENDMDDEHFAGAIESMTGDTFRIGGRTFKVNQATRLDNGLAVGVAARVEFVRLADGTLLATEIETDQGLRFVGNIESMTGNTWTVGGRTFTVNASTRLDEGLAVGRKARVRFTEQPAGNRVATRIQMDKSGPGGLEQRFEGALETKGTDAWVIGGKTFKVNKDTRIEGDLQAGQKVRVEFMTQPDGTLVATRIRVEN